LALDSSGNAWIANSSGDSVSVLSSNGAPLPGSPYSGGGISGPFALASDSTGGLRTGRGVVWAGWRSMGRRLLVVLILGRDWMDRWRWERGRSRKLLVWRHLWSLLPRLRCGIMRWISGP